MSELKISCLGGIGEIGMNLYIYETSIDAIVVDMGVMFPDACDFGIDMIFPDISYLVEIKSKLRGIIITHGHEDHVGFLLKGRLGLDLTIFTGLFTSKLIESKSTETGTSFCINIVQDQDFISFGSISVKFFELFHSIPDTFGFLLEACGLRCLHLSDFRLTDDFNIPSGADILMLDVTNCRDKSEVHLSEDDVQKELECIFSESIGNIFFTTFASNVRRIKSAIDIAKKFGMKVVLEGTAVNKVVGIASRLGLINFAEGDIVSAKNAYHNKNDRYLYIVSGCQGEAGSTLYSIAMDERKAIKIKKGDLFIFSARVIPGNAGNINKIVNSIIRHGAEVIEGNDRPVHTSGHANAKELEEIISHVSPHYFIPMHGEYRHLAESCKIASSVGVEYDNIIIMETGSASVFADTAFLRKESVFSGKCYYDSRGSFYLSRADLSLREQIAKDGLIYVNCHRDIDNSLRFHVDTFGFELSAVQSQELLRYLLGADECDGGDLAKAVKRFFRKFCNRRRPYVYIKNI